MNCPDCGSKMIYDAEVGEYICPRCGYSIVYKSYVDGHALVPMAYMSQGSRPLKPKESIILFSSPYIGVERRDAEDFTLRVAEQLGFPEVARAFVLSLVRKYRRIGKKQVIAIASLYQAAKKYGLNIRDGEIELSVNRYFKKPMKVIKALTSLLRAGYSIGSLEVDYIDEVMKRLLMKAGARDMDLGKRFDSYLSEVEELARKILGTDGLDGIRGVTKASAAIYRAELLIEEKTGIEPVFDLVDLSIAANCTVSTLVKALRRMKG